MAKDQKPADQMEAFGKDAVAQAHQAIDTYFDFLEKSVAFFPSGGTDFGEKLKVQSAQNIASVRELVKRLSQARSFEEVFRIQTAFMHSQLNALGKQAASFGETYAKEAAGGVKLPFKSSPDYCVVCVVASCPAFTNPTLAPNPIALSHGTPRTSSFVGAIGWT
jgi:hypothetical protein